MGNISKNAVLVLFCIAVITTALPAGVDSYALNRKEQLSDELEELLTVLQQPASAKENSNGRAEGSHKSFNTQRSRTSTHDLSQKRDERIFSAIGDSLQNFYDNVIGSLLESLGLAKDALKDSSRSHIEERVSSLSDVNNIGDAIDWLDTFYDGVVTSIIEAFGWGSSSSPSVRKMLHALVRMDDTSTKYQFTPNELEALLSNWNGVNKEATDEVSKMENTKKETVVGNMEDNAKNNSFEEKSIFESMSSLYNTIFASLGYDTGASSVTLPNAVANDQITAISNILSGLNTLGLSKATKK